MDTNFKKSCYLKGFQKNMFLRTIITFMYQIAQNRVKVAMDGSFCADSTFVQTPLKHFVFTFRVRSRYLKGTHELALYAGKKFGTIPCGGISRGKKIIINPKTTTSFFDHRTVYDSKKFHHFTNSTDLFLIKISWNSLMKIIPPLSQIHCSYRLYDPLYSNNCFHDLWLNIDCILNFSWLRFLNEGFMSFMKPPIVCRDNFRLLKVS